MPQISVDYSPRLGFDRRAFAAELHPLVAAAIDTTVESCKTRFRPVEDAFLGDGDPERAMVYLELKILAGRAPEARTALSESVLDLLKRHVDGERVHLAVNVVELDREVYRTAAL
ncbi:5-carboxymethyl-2-hydroxymuconate Delta-isomerase [Kitasatospora sp. DSM 101779]|uniref:5-carboxymethyl-2-hydroxymuconate Delta-isomerase n=1 Tax=Kitasatospora sp. DSM 101779 TaxID=2853165 RepID=UPI0021DA141D|nr:isomerase [Kitasatospora sp. DSM 101779]MCU7821513.1 isomerase [Kitasatospora sp. DSM 101779]